MIRMAGKKSPPYKIVFIYLYFKGVVRSQSWAVNQWQVTAKKGRDVKFLKHTIKVPYFEQFVIGFSWRTCNSHILLIYKMT